MEEDMTEDNLNEEETAIEYSFTAYEIDLDYEFEAARFFDFSRTESHLEARQAEVWFDSAASYPPSPFLARLVPREEILKGNINISPKSKQVDNMNLSESDSDAEVDYGNSAVDINYRDDKGQDVGTSTTQQIGNGQKYSNPPQRLPSGLTFYNHMVNDVNSHNKAKLSVKPYFPRTSTLMKPTASQLAKQNRPVQAGYSWSTMCASEKANKSSGSNCGVENQAAKRQKLEGGLLRKVVGAVEVQQANFVHKAPKRDAFFHGNFTHTKSKITIPREPDLETALRAHRTRPKSSKDNENVASTVRRFRALPLNKKILEAPSFLPKRSTPCLPDFHEFRLKTSERALRHTSTVSTHSAIPSLINDTSRPDGESSHRFKALPLNKKILTSKGDIGVFRNSKKETTVPMTINFQTETRSNHNPPIDLFNKLSLSSEVQPIPNSESRFPWSNEISAKGSKENRWGCLQHENEITAKNKLPLPGGPQQFCADKGKHEISSASSNIWNKGFR